MSSQNVTPGVLLKDLTDLANGLATKGPGGQPSLMVEGALIPVAELVTEFRGYAVLYQAVETAENEYKTKLAERAAIEARAKSRRDAVRAALKGALGKTNPQLVAYGITPNKGPRPLTVEEEALKVARVKATRAARHTMGKRQKLAIKGEVPPKG